MDDTHIPWICKRQITRHKLPTPLLKYYTTNFHLFRKHGIHTDIFPVEAEFGLDSGSIGLLKVYRYAFKFID